MASCLFLLRRTEESGKWGRGVGFGSRSEGLMGKETIVRKLICSPRLVDQIQQDYAPVNLPMAWG